MADELNYIKTVVETDATQAQQEIIKLGRVASDTTENLTKRIKAKNSQIQWQNELSKNQISSQKKEIKAINELIEKNREELQIWKELGEEKSVLDKLSKNLTSQISQEKKMVDELNSKIIASTKVSETNEKQRRKLYDTLDSTLKKEAELRDSAERLAEKNRLLANSEKLKKDSIEKSIASSNEIAVIQQKVAKLNKVASDSTLTLKQRIQAKTEAQRLQKIASDKTISNLEREISVLKRLENSETKVVDATKRLNRERVNSARQMASNEKQLNRLVTAQERANKSAGFFSKTFNGLAGRFAVASLAVNGVMTAIRLVGQAFRDAFERVKAFDDTMQEMAGIARVSRDELADIESKIIDVASGSIRTSNEVAKLASTLLTLGKTKEEIQSLLQPTNDLSIGLKASSEDAGEFLIQMLNAFGEPIEKAEEYADTIAAIRASTTLDFQKMRDSFQYIVPISNILNKDLEYTGALVGVLADNSIKAEQAGRLLGTAQLMLSKQGKTLNEGLTELNNTISSGASEVEILQKSGELFGKSASKVGAILAVNQEKIKLYEDRIRAADGALKDLVDERMESLASKLKELDSRWERFILNIDKGDGKLSNFFKSGIEGLGEFINTLDDLNTVLSSETPSTIKKVYDATIRLVSIPFKPILDGIKAIGDGWGWVAKQIGNTADEIKGGNVLGDTKEFLKTVDATDSFSDSIDNLSKKYDELIDKQKDLSSFSKLSKDDLEQLKLTTESLGKAFPEAISKYDEFGNAIEINTDKLRELKEASNELQKTQTLEYFNKVSKEINDLSSELSNLNKINKNVEGSIAKFNGTLYAMNDGVLMAKKGSQDWMEATDKQKKALKKKEGQLDANIEQLRKYNVELSRSLDIQRRLEGLEGSEKEKAVAVEELITLQLELDGIQTDIIYNELFAAKERERLSSMTLAQINAEIEGRKELQRISSGGTDTTTTTNELTDEEIKAFNDIQKDKIKVLEAYHKQTESLEEEDLQTHLNFLKKKYELEKSLKGQSVSDLKALEINYQTEVALANRQFLNKATSDEISIMEARYDALDAIREDAIEKSVASNQSLIESIKSDAQKQIDIETEKFQKEKSLFQGSKEELFQLEVQYLSKIKSIKETSSKSIEETDKAHRETLIKDIKSDTEAELKLEKERYEKEKILNKNSKTELELIEINYKAKVEEINKKSQERIAETEYSFIQDSISAKLDQINAEKNILASKRKAGTESLEEELDLMKRERDAILTDTKLTLSQRQAIEADYETRMNSLREAKRRVDREAEIADEERRIELIKSSGANALAEELKLIELKRQQELDNTELTLAQKAEIEDRYNKERIEAQRESNQVFLDTELEKLTTQREQILSNENLTNEEKARINAEFDEREREAKQVQRAIDVANDIAQFGVEYEALYDSYKDREKLFEEQRAKEISESDGTKEAIAEINEKFQNLEYKSKEDYEKASLELAINGAANAFGIEKELSLAKMLMSAPEAIGGVFKEGSKLPFPLNVAHIATGLATNIPPIYQGIREIKNTRFSKGSGSSGSGGSAGSVPTGVASSEVSNIEANNIARLGVDPSLGANATSIASNNVQGESTSNVVFSEGSYQKFTNQIAFKEGKTKI